MTIQERLIQFIEYKGISKYRFYKETGLSNGFLDKSGTIGVDKCELICSKYEDLSMQWLITGKGSMLNSNNTMMVSEPTVPYNVEKKNENLEYLISELRKKDQIINQLNDKIEELLSRLNGNKRTG